MTVAELIEKLKAMPQGAELASADVQIKPQAVILKPCVVCGKAVDVTNAKHPAAIKGHKTCLNTARTARYRAKIKPDNHG